MAVLRNVPKTFSFEEQRIEINEIAQDLYSLSSGNLTQFSVTVSAASGNGNLTYDNTTGVFDYTPPNISSTFSGDYNDLSNKPTLFSGDYNDLSNKPTLFSGSYNDLSNKPTIFSGSYNDLSNKPTIPITLNDLSDVDATTGVANGKILKYNGSGWEVADDQSGGGGSSYTNSNVDTHLNVSGASSGQILSWNGSDYVWVADQTGGGGSSNVSAINDLSDVVISNSPTAGHVIKWDQTTSKWTNQPDMTGQGGSDYQIYNFNVDVSNSSYFTISGHDRVGGVSGNNPTITMNEGDRIRFAVYNSGTNHTFEIRVSAGGAEVSNPAPTKTFHGGGDYIEWAPQVASGGSAGSYVYECDNHSSMVGVITVRPRNTINEFDTLQTVTARGSTTTNGITLSTSNLILDSANDQRVQHNVSGVEKSKIIWRSTGAVDFYASNGMSFFATSNTSPNNRRLQLLTGGGVILEWQNNTRLETTSTGVTISGVLTAGGLTYPNSNGTSGQVLSSDGTGNVAWSTVSIPAAQVNSDWSATSGLAEILNKPYLPTFSTTNPSDGQILTWNATSSEWQPDNVSSGSVTSINDIGDVNVPNPTDGHVLKWNASTSKWIASADLTATGGAGIALADLSVTTNSAGTAALTYSNTTGVFSYTPPDLSGYLTSLGDAAGVTTAKISNWDDAYSWGDHSLSGYATQTFVNTALTNLNNWDTAYGWGDHSAAGYLTSYTENDTLSSVVGRGNTATGPITIGGNGSSGGVTLKDGKIEVRTGTGNVAAIDLYCEVNNVHKISIKAPPHSNFSGNIDFVLPPNAGTSGKVLSTDGTGVTSWVDRSTFSGSYNDLTNKPTIPSTLDQLTDVSVGSVSEGDYLKYTSSGWTHGTITEFSGNYNDLSNKPTIPTNIGDLSDVDFSGSTTVGYVLKWDGSEWSPAQDTNYPTGGIGGLTDVDFGGGSPSNDQVLVYDSSTNKWKNESPSSGVPSGTIVMYNSGSAPSGWAVCDGTNGTPDLRGRFVLGSGGSYSGTGGSADAVVVSHSHNNNASSSTHNGHSHGQGNLSTSNEGGHSHNVNASGGSNTGNQSNNHYHTISENITIGGGSHSHNISTGDGTDDQGNSGPKDTSDWEPGYNRSTSNVGHNHNFNLTVPTQGISQNHTHAFNVTVNGNTDNQGSHSHNVTGSTGSDGSHDHSINVTIGSQGESGTGKNLPPYYVLTYIMKL